MIVILPCLNGLDLENWLGSMSSLELLGVGHDFLMIAMLIVTLSVVFVFPSNFTYSVLLK